MVRAEAGKGFALLAFALKSEFALKVAEKHEMLLKQESESCFRNICLAVWGGLLR